MQINEDFIIYFVPLIIILIVFLSQPVPYCFQNNGINENKEDQNINTINDSLSVQKAKISDKIILTTEGNSMFPTIKDGSRCLCQSKNNYHEGDIVFFAMDFKGEFIGILHRIISIENDKIVTKGDNNDFEDLPIKEENIICAVPHVKRYQLYD